MEISKNNYNIIPVVIPTLLILFAHLHSWPILVGAYILALLNIGKPFVLYPAMFITSLSTNYFVIVPGISNGLVFSLLVIISLLTTPSENKKSVFLLIWVSFLIFFNLISCLISVTGSLEPFFLMAQNLIILYLLSIKKNVDIERLSINLCFTSAVFVLILIATYNPAALLESDSGRYSVEGLNENRFAIILCQLGVVLCFGIFFMKQLIVRIVLGSVFLGALFLALMSGSRSGMIGFLSSFFVCILSFNINKSKKSSMLLPLIGLGIALYLGYNWLIDSDFAVMDRFTSKNIVEGRGTHRIDRFYYLLEHVFPENPIIGVGLGGQNIYAISPGPCHNIIFDPLFQIGILGFIMYWYLIISQEKRVFILVRHHHVILVLPLTLFVASFFNGMGETIFFEKFFWNAISLGILFANNVNNLSHISKGLLEHQ